jgi:hypothetical protein
MMHPIGANGGSQSIVAAAILDEAAQHRARTLADTAMTHGPTRLDSSH